MPRRLTIIRFGWLGALLLASCRLPALDLANPVTPTPEVLSQWAAGATASTSYGFPDWGPNRARGAPEVGICGDDPRAWASARGNGVEWLQVSFARPVNPWEVSIHQTFGRGAISRVTVLDEEGNGLVIWEGVDSETACPGVLVVRVEATLMRVSEVRIDLDESRTGTWNQIDAVELVGVP